MKKNLYPLIVLLLMAACQSAVKPQSPANTNTDTVKPFHDHEALRPFGHFFLLDGLRAGKRGKPWQPISFKVSDNEVFRAFDILKLADARRVDSVKKANGNGLYQKSIFKSPVMLGVKLNPATSDYILTHQHELPGQYTGYHLRDSTEAVLIALGIDDKNVKDFKYRVTEEGSKETMPWAVPPLQQQYGAKKPYAYLGRYKLPGKRVTVEVWNTKDSTLRDGMIFDWRPSVKPIISHLMVKTTQDYFDVSQLKGNHGTASKFDAETGLPLDFHFTLHRVNDLYLVFKNHQSVLYNLYLIKNVDGRRDTALIDNNVADENYALNHKLFDRPGNYQLVVQPVNFWDNVRITQFRFKVTPVRLLHRRYALRQIMPYVFAALALLLTLFAIYYQYNRRKLNKAAQQKKIANLQLKSIRAQLNPHFMFNALSAIQNLMNKHDVEGANHYLAKFANLTRKVLHSGEQELISIEDEVAILDDYLQMEQLRFGFQYKIEVDETINRANTEIPAMLLQPFVENAVKHGVAALQNNGLISILIQQQQQNLVLTVLDNGPGFDVNSGNIYQKGFGLKLSLERIALLNDVYDSHTNLLMRSEPGSTSVIVRLSNWL